LTWAAGERANRIAIEGPRGKLGLDGGRVTLAGAAGEQSWSLPSIAEGSHHPEWFGGVLSEFLGEIADPERRGRNLTEAAFCADALALARESSRLGGKSLPL
ncbi:MAG: hypothetical protein ACRD1B_04605, partial [Thermoanaerobaculia bacterium]